MSFLDSPLVRPSSRRVAVSPGGMSEGVDRDMVLGKCRSVIEALHEELEEERRRGERLERSLVQERHVLRQLEGRHAEHVEQLNRKFQQEISVCNGNLDTLASEHSKLLADLAARDRLEHDLRSALARKAHDVVELEKTVVAISDQLLQSSLSASKAQAVPMGAWDEKKVEKLRSKLEHKILTLKLKLNEMLDSHEASLTNNRHI